MPAFAASRPINSSILPRLNRLPAGSLPVNLS
jgi:hypothetical protein